MKMIFNGLNQPFEHSNLRYEHKSRKTLYFVKHHSLTIYIYICLVNFLALIPGLVIWFLNSASEFIVTNLVNFELVSPKVIRWLRPSRCCKLQMEVVMIDLLAGVIVIRNFQMFFMWSNRIQAWSYCKVEIRYNLNPLYM
jgi:hypothetical protein